MLELQFLTLVKKSDGFSIALFMCCRNLDLREAILPTNQSKEMIMYIHAIAHNHSEAFAITEAQGSGGGRGWGIWKKVRLIRFDLSAAQEVANELNKIGHRCERSFEVLDAYEVDVRNDGPASGYGKALAELEHKLDQQAGVGGTRVRGASPSDLKALSDKAKH